MRSNASGPTKPFAYRHFGCFRLFLAMLVMLQHFGADLAPSPLAFALAPVEIGSIAVLVFFALSGFVITEAIDCVYRRRAGAFLCNRLLRIVPHFVLALMFSMLAHATFRWVGGVRLWRSQPSFPANVFEWHNIALNFGGILPGIDRHIDYNFLDIAWAVRVEVAFYLVMAICIWVGRQTTYVRSFAVATGCAALVLTFPFYRAVHGQGAGMFEFLPYFVFGAALYYASVGHVAAWLAVGVAVPLMLWQFVTRLPASAGPFGVPMSVPANVATLAVLLCVLVSLVFVHAGRLRRADSSLGNLTYPLYLYHEDVQILLMTFTVGYHYWVFAAGLLLSVVAALMMGSLIDPLVNRLRDQIRGTSIARAAINPPSGVLIEQPTTAAFGIDDRLPIQR